MTRIWVLAVLLAGCSPGGFSHAIDATAPGQSPIVRGDNGFASVTLILCPKTRPGVEAAQELLMQMMQLGGELVVARNNGTARLIVNACPAPELMVPALAAAAAKR